MVGKAVEEPILAQPVGEVFVVSNGIWEVISEHAQIAVVLHEDHILV